MINLPALKIINSGKKEGNGGIDAFTIRSIPAKRIAHLNLLSEPSKCPKREVLACLNNPALANNPIEAHAWAKDIIITLIRVNFLQVANPIAIKVMCATLLYAINFLMSLCIMVRTLARIAPKNQTKEVSLIEKNLILARMRNIPYPPSLSKRPAKIIDPLVLASTWAFGNQKWTPKTGSFTKKGEINIKPSLIPTNGEDSSQKIPSLSNIKTEVR